MDKQLGAHISSPIERAQFLTDSMIINETDEIREIAPDIVIVEV